ncbi:hypothetical protein NQ314_019823 [Rhamnusium bicolor]|uniref:Glucosylceramidase n=1 Tax=Rhamnusium bicolor TaxID=1586634 RepID=A0AAV8WNF0_9CUCU|nr:hypothetical protein NQ314_019823 [Rhamnusium bicolor]
MESIKFISQVNLDQVIILGKDIFQQKKDSFTTIKINKRQYQSIVGFGGAFTDATGINIRSLPEGAQKKLLESYFGENGIKYSICRVPIGGTDFSTRPYSYDDHPNDVNLEHFELQQEDFFNKIPFIKEAKTLRNNNLKLIASAWTAPPWMKTKNIYTGYALLKEENYQLWANYAIKFFDEYKKHDIDFWGMTTGNEPMDGFYSHTHSLINAMGWVPIMQNKWIKENLGPSLRESVHKDIKILIHDDDRLTVPYVVPLMLNDETTLKYIDGVALHWYWDAQVPPDVLSLTKSNRKDVFLLSTESCNLCIFLDGYLEYDAIGWIDWNMALNLTGGPTYIDYLADSPIIVNATAQEFYKQPMFYALGHFSKFVIPGSVRLDISCNHQQENNIKALAFLRPDNLIALVVFNKLVNILQTISKVVTNIFSGSINISVQVENDNFYSSPVDVEANSVYSVLFPKEAEKKKVSGNFS